MEKKKTKRNNGGAKPNAGRPTMYRPDTPAVIADLIRKTKTIGGACAAYGCSRTVLSNWRKMYPELEEAIREATEDVGDIIESKFFQKIEQGDTQAILFGLKTRLRDRGYSERQELVGADGAPLVPAITFVGQLPEGEDEKL